jgi:RNA polymerase sigma-70 factor (ECF subfamily)
VERVQAEVPYGTAAFQQLVDDLGPLVYARARRILGSSEDANDALQEVFLRVFRSIATYRFERPFTHWLQTITLNSCRQMLRTRRREQRRRVAYELEPARDTTPDPPRDPMLRGLLAGLLESLDPDTRICVVLRVLEDRSYAEIADELQVKEATVRKRVQRGTERLRKLYGEQVQREEER